MGNIRCDECNARLIASTQMIPPEVTPPQEELAQSPPLKGISLPSRVGSSQGADTPAVDLPDWMLDLSDDDGAFTAAVPAAQNEGGGGGYADWLSDLLDEGMQIVEPDEEAENDDPDLLLDADQLPDWLASGVVEPDPAPMEEEVEEELPDWLRSISDQLGPPSEAPPSEAPPSEAPPLTTEPTMTSLPDWLSDIDALEDNLLGVASVQESDTWPHWLAGGQGEVKRHQPEDVDDSPAFELSPPGDSLGWQVQQERAEDSGAPAEAEDDIRSSNDNLPDWLAEAEIEDRDETAPDSVADIGSSAPVPTARLSIDEASLELPDWLAAMAKAEDESTDDLGIEAEPRLEDTPGVELPDWLVSLSQAEEVDAPSPINPVADTSTQELQPSEPGSAEQHSPEQDDVPYWLTEIGTQPSAPSPAVFTSSPQALDQDPPQPDSPSWLEDVAADKDAASVLANVPAFVTDVTEEEPVPQEDETVEVPEWLQELETSSSDETEALSEVDAALHRADLPAWLRNLRPPEAGGSAADAGVRDEDVLIPADIPDWVQAMRPVSGERGNGMRDRIGRATLAEAEGPLVGLPGVIPGLAFVDIPSGTPRDSDGEIPQAVVQQAQLWQHLLEQPRSAERPITQASRGFRSSSLVRVVVSLILLLGLFAAILLVPETVKLSEATPLQVSPGAAVFVESIDRIETGHRILLALEYTPAYGDEIAHMARPILEHLDDRQAQLVVASTIPEGTALGLGLIAAVRYEGIVTDAGYLAGNYNGIASFLQTAEAQSVDHIIVLTSQSERLRWWIEQVAATGSQEQIGMPLSVAVTASARPLAAPYLQAGGVQGWIAGFSGGLAYREVRGDALTGFYSRAWDVLMMGHWFVAALLFVGVLYSLIAGKKGAH